ncbi:conserved hypothetical protein [Theileria orientalis strain Shintoku]|uniref:Ion transport domain-containing protein n=1 Tax=Theileria orientalis strain Shintoku TaxID=869250 RepID=J4DNL8_THEOR|nr:conserved hypothetical protein [Theileria orientalis strain Shintoku]PVC51924.1 hypothetical protein MACL_00001205 [Theileria orientalis]BAM39184.1 conserved hypothetical protein [Theileria orientalis strain Shintoku]|eukprot:XP_009689485.1 conserved hypothetical protein [Theileria orientalis strain Shintoku]
MKYPDENDHLLQDHSHGSRNGKKTNNSWSTYQNYELNRFKSGGQKPSEPPGQESNEYTSKDTTFENYQYGAEINSQNIYTNQRPTGLEVDLMSNKFNKLCVELYNSDYTTELYFYLLLANIVILIDTMFFDKFICIFLEFAVIVFFFMEVYSNYLLHGSKYYKSIEGLVDTTMLSCCILYITSGGYLRYHYGDVARPRSAEYFEVFLILVRLVVQFYRLIRYFFRHRKAKHVGAFKYIKRDNKWPLIDKKIHMESPHPLWPINAPYVWNFMS